MYNEAVDLTPVTTETNKITDIKTETDKTPEFKADTDLIPDVKTQTDKLNDIKIRSDNDSVPHLVYMSGNLNGYQILDLVNITDKGRLKGLTLVMSYGTGNFAITKINIDGTLVSLANFAYPDSGQKLVFPFNFDLPFNTSLRVYLDNSGTSGQVPYCAVLSYTTD